MTDSPADNDALLHARHVLDVEIEALQRARANLSDAFSAAVALLQASLAAGGKLVVCGVGKSYHIGQKIAATFTSTGVPAMMLHPSEAMHGDLGLLQPHDALLALSYSGESDEMVRLLPMIDRAGVPVIALTGNAASTLARHAAVVLDASVEREACPFNMVPTASTSVALALGDALCIALLHARGLTREEYSSFHPGGAIGRALLLKVDEVMRTGDRLAAVPAAATVREALVAMTRAQAGAVAVLDPATSAVAGILTDGDLRRCLLSGDPGFLDAPVSAYMSPRPTTIRLGALAASALKLFQEHRFDDLPVVDADGRLAGMIDLQDLPKFKVF